MKKITLNGINYNLITDYDNHFTLEQYNMVDGLLDPVKSALLNMQTKGYTKEQIESGKVEFNMSDILGIIKNNVNVPELLALILLEENEEEFDQRTYSERKVKLSKVKIGELKKSNIFMEIGTLIDFFMKSLDPVFQAYLEVTQKMVQPKKTRSAR